MPRIRLSERTLQPVSRPNVHLGPGWIGGVRALRESAYHEANADQAVVRAIDTAIVGADRIAGIIDRRAEKDADEAATVWEASMLAGLEGTVGQDGKRHGGILQKSWTDYSDGKSSPITDLGEIEKGFQASDTYKNLGGLAREKFNRRVMTRRARYLADANRQFDKNEQARTAFFDKQADDLGAHKIETAIYADDDTFEKVVRDETFAKMGRKFRPLMENPEILDQEGASPDMIKWKDPKAELYFKGAILASARKNAIGRVSIMAKQAAAGEVTWTPDGKLVVNDVQLTAAERYAVKLAQPQTLADGTKLPARITPEEAKALRYECLQARATLDDRIRGEINTKTQVALLSGDLKTLSESEAQMRTAAGGLRPGTHAQAAALSAAARLGKAADMECVDEIYNDMVSGKSVLLPGGKTTVFRPGSRQQRCYPAAAARYQDLLKKDMSTNDTELRYAEAAIDHMIQSGTYSDAEIARARRKVYEKGVALETGLHLTPEDGASFRKRWSDRNKADESRAAVEFDRAFGVSFDLKSDGETSEKTSTLVKNSSEYTPKYPGTGDEIELREYLKMRSAYLERLRALDPASDRVAETRQLLSEFKSGWFKNRTAKNIDEMTRRMTEINNEATARVEAERIQAAQDEQKRVADEKEAERKRTLPVVSMEHPANQPKKNEGAPEDPLDFYGVLGSQYLRQ